MDHGTNSSLENAWKPAPDRFLTILDDPYYRLVLNLQDTLTHTTANFWRTRGVKAVHLPITTDSISSPMGRGSDSLPVQIDLFGRPTYLADSMQFMLEYGCRLNRAGTWYLMPSFRGEGADHTHLNQFFHSEAEIAGGLDEVIAVVEDYLRHLARATVDAVGADLEVLGAGSDHLVAMAEDEKFDRMSLDEAVDHLHGDDRAVIDHGDYRSITRHGEQRLMAERSPFLWLTHFDHLSVPFYQAYDPTDPARALNADLLFGIGETVGAGQRHVTGDDCRAALEHHHVDAAPYDWYLRMKDAYPQLTSGFGMGVERWMMWALGARDIRELQLAPRLNGVAIAP